MASNRSAYNGPPIDSMLESGYVNGRGDYIGPFVSRSDGGVVNMKMFLGLGLRFLLYFSVTLFTILGIGALICYLFFRDKFFKF